MSTELDRTVLFIPEHLAVDPDVRRLLLRLIKLDTNTIEFVALEFIGYITYRVPGIESLADVDLLTVCAEMAQRELGLKADVKLWLVTRPADGLVSFQPHDFDLQDEDREVPPWAVRS